MTARFPKTSYATSATRGLANAVLDVVASVAGIERRTKRRLVMAADIFICAFAVFLAFSLRVGALSFPLDRPLLVVAVAIPLFLPIFVIRGVYRSIFRYSGGGTIAQLALACAIFSVPMVLIFLAWGVAGVPRTIGLIQPILFFGLTAGLRILIRYLVAETLSDLAPGQSISRVLIYGAGKAGQQLALSLRHERGYVLVGFIDDDRHLQGQKLDGVTIWNGAELARIIDDKAVDTVLLAMPGMGRGRRKKVIESIRHFNVRVQILPRVREVMDGKVSLSDLREIQIEDLLSRDLVAPNELLLGRNVIGKTVLVTGAGGSIGSELSRQIAGLGPKRLVLAEMSELALFQIETELREKIAAGEIGPVEIVAEMVNLVDAKVAGRLFRKFEPDTVFHAAAYKHVPLVEANVLSGLRNNIFGTLNAAKAARDVGVTRFILVSTDKAVRPTNVMGASKRICELILQALVRDGASDKTRFGMVRFGNVLGSSGSVVPRFKKQINEGGPLTVTHRDMTRYFMTIPEAAQLVIQAGALVEGGEVYLLDMGEPVKIFDLAAAMVELSGLTVRTRDNPDGDIAIEEVGLRPGEKLFEELLIDSQSEPTTHPRIFKARESCLAWPTLEPKLDVLKAAVDRGCPATAMEVVHELVPEYAPDMPLMQGRA